MTLTPAPRYVCPRCRSAFGELSRYCRECGADMHRASALDAAARSGVEGGRAATDAANAAAGREADRRLSESNRAWLGKIVDGRYRVIDVLGRGGMGVVYKVEHLRMGKIAAMKVLHRDLADDPDVISRFEREAHAVSQLVHPNTVQVFDFGAAQGALYLIMEHVRGQDLQRIVDRDGPMPWARVAPLLIQIGGALQEAHDVGIIHRDLKPDNVIISRTTGGRDFAKVLDFGLAKLEHREPRPDVTDRAQIVGTPYFMAPEQIRGDEVDARTDIYAMGAMMFRLLTGEYLFTAGSAVGVLTKHLTVTPDAPSQRAPDRGLDPRVDHICLRALAKDPADRWPSVTAMVQEIEEVFAELVGDASSGGRVIARSAVIEDDDDDEPGATALELRRADLDSFERGLRRRRWTVAGGALLGLGAAAAAVGWVLTRPSPPRSEEAEPNDEQAQATPIVAGGEVTGLLGRRRSVTEGDRDMFRVAWPIGSRHLVTTTVTAPPNVDVTLGLRRDDGGVIALANDGGVGDRERLRRRWVEGPLLVEVAQVATTGGALPVENVSDPYVLVVQEETDEPGWESEPNGGGADATPIAAGGTVRGYLDARSDVDVLRWTGPAGKVAVELEPGPIPMTWTLADGVVRTAGATVTLAEGALISLERSDRDDGPGPLPGVDAAYAITLRPAP
ncbi:MAG: serine/threonine-protein kinase [Kofleriaceae bacterium]